MKKKNNKPSISKHDREFAEIGHSIAFLWVLRKLAKQMGIAVTRDTPEELKKERENWEKLKSYVPSKHHHKLPKLIRAYAREMWNA